MRKRFLAAAATLAISSGIVFSLPSPARADDVGTDAAVGAAVGSLVGALLFDSQRNAYYYDNGDRPVYVSNTYARNWYAHRDPGYWHSHYGPGGDRYSGNRYARGGPEHGGYYRGGGDERGGRGMEHGDGGHEWHHDR